MVGSLPEDLLLVVLVSACTLPLLLCGTGHTDRECLSLSIIHHEIHSVKGRAQSRSKSRQFRVTYLCTVEISTANGCKVGFCCLTKG